MFSVGEFVVYGTTGVCLIEEIGTLQMAGISKEQVYYTMMPLGSKESKVYVPIDNNKTILRTVISKEEAKELVDNIPSIELLGIEDEKKREEIYKKAYRACDCVEWIKLIKTIYLRKVSRIEEGKKIVMLDEKYLHLAEEKLYTELGLALGMTIEEVLGYITQQVEKSE